MNASTKTAKVFSIVFTLGIFGIGSAAADSAAEVAALSAVDQTWIKSYNSGDVDTVVSLYDEHAVLLPPGAPAARGPGAIRAFFTKDMGDSAKAGLVFSIGPKPEGGVSGDMGWSSGTYVVKDKAGHVVDAGKYFSVSAKKGGKWLYVRDMWNSDGPQPSAESPKK